MSAESKQNEQVTALVHTGTEEFALEQNRAVEIAEKFLPSINATKALNAAFQKIVASEITETTVNQAKALRLRYVKLRTGTAAIHKEEKNAFLNGGRFVDSCKNIQIANGEPCETKLKEIENHFETLRKDAIEKLQVEREGALVQFGVEAFPSLLGEMEEAVWDGYINGVKLNFEAKAKEAAEAEALRVKAEEEARAEQEQVRLENEKLKAEADKREAVAKKEQKARDKAAKIEAGKRAKIEAERVAKEKAAAALRLKLEAEIQATKDAEALAEKEAEAAKQAELSKGDEEKIADLIDSVSSIKTSFKFESYKNKAMFANVCVLCDKVVKYINDQKAT